ncbi:GNAT family N-acetyltransferase [Levilactobacillus enshiensis]|uniref:GNAT family N-acetyltransferase n=1 Tax=Levilactobacillus enshiensis TaxID=2590213 RepID=UPI00131A6FAD|nr:GNAT family protein [Levilactobacillus enshiensis]
MTDFLQLKEPAVTDATALYNLIEQDRAYLEQWLPWADSMQSAADEAAFLQYSQQRNADRKLWLRIIWVADQPAGMIDIHEMKDGHGEIGYWLGRDFRKRGVVSHCLALTEQAAFTALHLNKLIILAATANTASRHVAERNHYHLDGILRQHIPSGNDYHDAAIYSKLKTEQ